MSAPSTKAQAKTSKYLPTYLHLNPQIPYFLKLQRFGMN